MQTAGAAAGTINLTELMDNCRIGPLQVRVFALCLASLIMDGFDVQVMGFVATTMFAEWNVPASDARARCSPGATPACSPAPSSSACWPTRSDAAPCSSWATLFFSVMTVATAFAQDIEQMHWLRFIAGFGLGSIIPNATALVGEFSPKRTRVAWIMCITVGFTLGAAISGFVANALIDAFGWRVRIRLRRHRAVRDRDPDVRLACRSPCSFSPFAGGASIDSRAG